MADGLQIAPASPADLDAIHRIEVDSFPAPWRREFFESELLAGGRLCLVARRAQKVVGYLFAMPIVDEMHISKIAVAAPERRRGIADALMEHCLTFARAESVRTLILEVRKSNLGAQHFYNHLGFETAYIRRRYYPDGESAVVMTLELE